MVVVLRQVLEALEVSLASAASLVGQQAASPVGQHLLSHQGAQVDEVAGLAQQTRTKSSSKYLS